MDDDVRQAINAQINREFFAAYLYLAMAAHFQDQNLDGFAHWMKEQAKEERDHAMRLFDHLIERGERVELEAIAKPPTEFDSALSIFQKALEHERTVTRHINELYELAREKKDYPAEIMLQWFIEEQVEEEDMTGQLVEQLEMAGDNRAALLMMDARLGSRGGGGH